jgi:hypothetical protein
MTFPINGDLVPSLSGRSNLGVNVGVNGENAFDITTVRPFSHIHQNSGVFHDPLTGQSGVLRYSQAAGAFQVSVDGGVTFLSLSAGVGVDSVGVIGDANLTGNVDFATPSSGFMTIQDTGDASPLLWSVDHLGLSGLWDFPSQGFSNLARCYSEAFGAATSWTVNHELGTSTVGVTILDDSSPAVVIVPDEIEITDANTVTVSFNVAQAGTAIVTGC